MQKRLLTIASSNCNYYFENIKKSIFDKENFLKPFFSSIEISSKIGRNFIFDWVILKIDLFGHACKDLCPNTAHQNTFN